MYQQYLKQRYGNVMIQSVGKDQSSMDKIGAATSGTGNVVIAPNILEQMADDPKRHPTMKHRSGIILIRCLSAKRSFHLWDMRFIPPVS